ISSRVLLGHGYIVVSNRGRVERRWQGPIDLGHLRAHTRQNQEWRYRRRRQRSLSPLQGGRRADEGLRRECLPFLDRLAAHFPEWNWSAKSQGARLLQPSGGRASRRWHCTICDAVSLGFAADIAR